MKKAIAMTAFLWCCCAALGGKDDAPLPPQPLTAQGQKWILRSEFSDGFRGAVLDREKWDDDIPDWSAWSWEPENVRLEGGLLKLRMQYREHERAGRKIFYTSAAIRSRAPSIRYGYFEARIKAAPLFPGVSPAFWMFRKETNLWTELDFELTQSKNVRQAQANAFVFCHPKLAAVQAKWVGGPKIGEHQDWESSWDPRDAFHVYGIEWDEQEIKWYIDGELVRSRPNEFWHQALNVIVSFGLRPPYKVKPSSEGFPTEFETDYVRVWKSAVLRSTAGTGGH